MMDRKHKNRLLLSGKILLGLVLLVWVLSAVHWGDYLLARPEHGGKTWTLQDSGRGEFGQPPTRYRVVRGILFWRQSRDWSADHFQPLDESGQLMRKGLRGSLGGIRWGYFCVAILGFPLSLILVAFRWRMLLGVLDIRLAPFRAIRLTFLGQFYNQVVPGMVGGDLVKAWCVRGHASQLGGVLLSLFVDRMVGLVELILMSGVMFAWVLLVAGESFESLRLVAVTLAVATGAVLGAGAFLFSERLRRWFHLQKLYGRLPIAHHFRAAGDAARRYRSRPGVILCATGLTVAAHLAFFGAIAGIGLSLSLTIPPTRYFVFLPLIYIIGAVPITPGGVGLVEKLYLTFFCIAATVGASEVLALALLARVIPIFWSLLGPLTSIRAAKPVAIV